MKQLSSSKKTSENSDRLDGYKELTPVIYGKEAVKYNHYHCEAKEKLLFKPHWHERLEIIQVISGSMKLILSQESFLLFPKDTVIINSRELHAGYSGPDGVAYHVLMFDVQKLFNKTTVTEKYLTPICSHKALFHTFCSDFGLLNEIDRLITCLQAKKEGSSLIALGIVYEILGILCSTSLVSKDITPKNSKSFEDVIEYINVHYSQKLSSKALSERFNYNEAYFCRRFKEVTGLSAMNYLQIVRLEKAQKLLEEGIDEIHVIAASCGFHDPCYFSNCFKKHFGYTPTQFRKLQHDLT